jgi:hypothetical protein
MCQDNNCKYIELVEDGCVKIATHYGIDKEGKYYVLWVDTWETEIVMDFAGNLVPCQQKINIFRPKNKTRKIHKNRVIVLK